VFLTIVSVITQLDTAPTIPRRCRQNLGIRQHFGPVS
jgi:hypothetical protein